MNNAWGNVRTFTSFNPYPYYCIHWIFSTSSQSKPDSYFLGDSVRSGFSVYPILLPTFPRTRRYSDSEPLIHKHCITMLPPAQLLLGYCETWPDRKFELPWCPCGSHSESRCLVSAAHRIGFLPWNALLRLPQIWFTSWAFCHKWLSTS